MPGAERFHATSFDELARVEAESFWFRSRNKLLVNVMRRWFAIAKGASFPAGGSLLVVGRAVLNASRTRRAFASRSPRQAGVTLPND